MAVNAATVDDVAYVGFVLGPGGDALQMLGLAVGCPRVGARVRIIVPEIPSSVAFAERCHAAGSSASGARSSGPATRASPGPAVGAAAASIGEGADRPLPHRRFLAAAQRPCSASSCSAIAGAS